MLTMQQMTVLQAVVNRIIPPDYFPSGWDAGVGDYLLRQFEGDLASEVDTYRQGLDAIEAEAQLVGGAFADIDTAAQDALLTKIEQGDIQAAWSINSSIFFSMLVDHCMEGFYSNPENGGNKDGIAWQMIGFEVRG